MLAHQSGWFCTCSWQIFLLRREHVAFFCAQEHFLEWSLNCTAGNAKSARTLSSWRGKTFTPECVVPSATATRCADSRNAIIASPEASLCTTAQFLSWPPTVAWTCWLSRACAKRSLIGSALSVTLLSRRLAMTSQRLEFGAPVRSKTANRCWMAADLGRRCATQARLFKRCAIGSFFLQFL